MISAKINIQYKNNHSTIIQTVTITPQKIGHLKYFLNNKYRAGQKLEDKLRAYYIGDGENLVFEKQLRHSNILVFVYKIIKPVKRDFSNIEFTIFTEIPTNSGCINCAHYRQKYSRCLYLAKMNITLKKTCVAFEEKGTK